MGRSPHARPGQLSFQLRKIEPTEEGLRIDLLLQNGTTRYYRALMLRVVTHGPKGALLSVRLPSGGIHPSQDRLVSAHFPPLGHPLMDVTLELIWATE